MNQFKTNHDLLEAQQRDFTKGGALVRNLFSISTRHPWLSLLFVLTFGLLTNALFELMHYATTTPDLEPAVLAQLVLLSLLFTAVPCWVCVRIRSIHKDLFVPTPLNHKKVLVTIVSKDRSDFKQTPCYNTYESLLYTPTGHAAPNALQRVVLVVSESSDVLATATALKAHIEASGRTVEIFGITIGNKSLLEIQSQVEVLFTKLKANYKPHEIIADYTGGTKDMSIALLRVSEKELVVPIYLNAATVGNHSRYS